MDTYTQVDVLRACCCIAGADGKASDKESVLLQKFAKQIGVGKASLDAMIQRAETDQEFYKQHFTVLKAEPTKTLAMLFEVAMADGQIEDTELNMLRGLAINLEVPPDAFEQIRVAARKAMP